MMKISKAGIALLKHFEGCELEAYYDAKGVLTIAWGHTGPDVYVGMKISPEGAEEMLRIDLSPRERTVRDLVTVPLNQNEFDAMVVFVYNIGEANFRTSTALRRLNRNDRAGAAEAMTWFNKITVKDENGRKYKRELLGLTRRRAAEKELFLTPYVTAVEDDPMPHRESNARPDREKRPLMSTMGWRGWIFTQCDPMGGR